MLTHVHFNAQIIWDDVRWSLAATEVDEDGHSESRALTGGAFPVGSGLNEREMLVDIFTRVAVWLDSHEQR